MSSLRSILPYYRPYRSQMLWGIVLVVIAQGFALASPWFVKLAIDGLSDGGQVTIYAILVVVTALIGGAARYGMRELLNGVSRRMEVDIRSAFFNHLLTLDAAFFDRTRTGDLMSRATNDTQAVRQAAGPAVMYAVNTVVGFVLSVAVMLWISPTLTGLSMIPMILLPPIVIGFGRVIHRRYEGIQEHFSTMSTMVQENLTGVRIVRAYVQERDQARRFDAMNAEYRDRNVRLATASGLFHPLLQLISGVAMLMVLWFGGREVMAGRMTVGDLVAFFFYLGLLIWPMIALGWVVNLFQRGAASMGRLNAILDTRSTIPVPKDPAPTTSLRGDIEFRSVSFRYPDTDRMVLENASFHVKPGETVAIVGPTGSGKSTLIGLLARLRDPSGGEILLDGVPLTFYDPAELRRAIGMVPQDPFLFSETIQENIGLGLPDATLAEDPDEAILEAAKVAQLHDSILGFPLQYNTLLGERGINLSGGQKQRATLARAVARDPKILDDLKRVMKGRTSFIISHRVSAVMGADQILVLDEGRIVERGKHVELIALGGTYATLLHRQMIEASIEEEALPTATAGD